MFKVATLLEKKEDGSLEVCIRDDEFERMEDAKSNIGNTPEQVIRGSIVFSDERSPDEILMDFAFIYKSPKKMGLKREGDYPFARYDKSLTIIPLAFVEYFSKNV